MATRSTKHLFILYSTGGACVLHAAVLWSDVSARHCIRTMLQRSIRHWRIQTSLAGFSGRKGGGGAWKGNGVDLISGVRLGVTGWGVSRLPMQFVWIISHQAYNVSATLAFRCILVAFLHKHAIRDGQSAIAHIVCLVCLEHKRAMSNFCQF